MKLEVAFSKYQIHWHLGSELHSIQNHKETMFVVIYLLCSIL